jgi:hypothetical protein
MMGWNRAQASFVRRFLNRVLLHFLVGCPNVLEHFRRHNRKAVIFVFVSIPIQSLFDSMLQIDRFLTSSSKDGIMLLVKLYDRNIVIYYSCSFS